MGYPVILGFALLFPYYICVWVPVFNARIKNFFVYK